MSESKARWTNLPAVLRGYFAVYPDQADQLTRAACVCREWYLSTKHWPAHVRVRIYGPKWIIKASQQYLVNKATLQLVHSITVVEWPPDCPPYSGRCHFFSREILKQVGTLRQIGFISLPLTFQAVPLLEQLGANQVLIGD